MIKSLILCACLTVLLAGSGGCEFKNDPPADEIVDGFVPVYGTEEFSEIRLLSSKKVKNPGRIYVYGGYLFINELKEGIHVFKNDEPTSPEPVAFIQMLGNEDMAIKDGVLYANHSGNLVALSLNDLSSIHVLGELPLSGWHYGIPAPSGHHFQCIEPSRGIVVDWMKAKLTNPECYAY